MYMVNKVMVYKGGRTSPDYLCKKSNYLFMFKKNNIIEYKYCNNLLSFIIQYLLLLFLTQYFIILLFKIEKCYLGNFI